MNVITIAGQLGKDSEIRFMPNGDPICGFSVADSQGKEKPTIWWNCSLYGKRAESLGQYLTKGQAVTVTGSITERDYTDKQGNKRKAQEIRVNDIALQGGKRESHQPEQRQNTTHAKSASGFTDMSSVMDDDIPFISCDWALEVDTSKSKRMRRYDY